MIFFIIFDVRGMVNIGLFFFLVFEEFVVDRFEEFFFFKGFLRVNDRVIIGLNGVFVMYLNFVCFKFLVLMSVNVWLFFFRFFFGLLLMIRFVVMVLLKLYIWFVSRLMYIFLLFLMIFLFIVVCKVIIILLCSRFLIFWYNGVIIFILIIFLRLCFFFVEGLINFFSFFL